MIQFAKRHRSVLCALVLNLLFLTLCMGFSHMQFGTNDDRDISNLLANVYGGRDGHYIAFVNVFFCRAMAWIYQITNNAVNWYVLVCVVGSFFALFMLSELLLRRARHFGVGVGLVIVLLALLSESHYIVFQFTQNAALYTTAGVLLLADCLLHDWDRGALLRALAGIFLVLAGSMLRFQSIFFTLPYLALYFGYELIFTKKPEGLRHWFLSRWKALVSVGMCVVLVFGARMAHFAVYRMYPSVQNYYEENLMRAELLDYGVPDYESNAEAMEALGMTWEDMELFTAQSYLDRDVFTRDVLEGLIAMKSEQSASYSADNLKLSAVGQVFRSIGEDLSESVYWQVLLLIFLFFLFGTDRKRWLVGLGSLVLGFGMLWYFESVGRMPYRIWYSITAPLLASSLYLCALGRRARETEQQPQEHQVQSRQPARLIACTVMLTACVAVCIPVVRYAAWDDTEEITDTYQKMVEYAEARPETFFLMDRPSLSRLTYTSTVTPLTCLSRTSHQNICIQGGWICWTLANQSVIERWGESNVYQAIGDGMDACVMGEAAPEAELSFIQRHYNPNVCLEQVDSINDIGIYRFYIAEGE